MRRFLSIAVVGALLVCFSGCDSIVVISDSSKAPSDSEMVQSEPQESETPIIKGSNAYDLTVSLKDTAGLEMERREKSSENGFYFEGTSDKYSVTIETDEDYAVTYMRADSFSGENDGFLGFCASFPRDDGNEQEAMNWVNDNWGTEASTTFGDVSFELKAEESTTYLIVKAPGYDDYALSVLESAEE